MDGSPRGHADHSRKGYSDEEVRDIYSLGKLLLDTGHHKRAEVVLHGLNEVAPEFAPAWLGVAFLRSVQGDIEGGLIAARNALRAEPESSEAMLYVVAFSLTLGDVSTAGTYLGEVGDAVTAARCTNEHVARFYRMQLARYQARGR